MNKSLLLCLAFTLGMSTAEAHPGIGIVMDSKGNVFYTDLNHVWKISPAGTRSIAVRDVHTHELYLDADDNLYGEHEWYNGEDVDTWGNYVWCLTKEGTFRKTIPDVEGFLDNNTLVRDPQGNSFWSKKTGDFQYLYRQTGTGHSTQFTNHPFKDIRWMYYSEFDKHLYVVDYLEIKRVTRSGEVTVMADNLKEPGNLFDKVSDRHYIFGMWADQSKALYVAIYGAGKVGKVTADGHIDTIFESEKGWSPCGGMVSPDGTLWIMEFSTRNKTRVRRISPDGKHNTFGG